MNLIKELQEQQDFSDSERTIATYLLQHSRLLPSMTLPLDRLCWIDAGENGGLVARYEIFHLPTLLVVRDGAFYGELKSRLSEGELAHHIRLALMSKPDELP